MQLLKIALVQNFGSLLDYLPPEDIELEYCHPGIRVLVPFGKRRCVGIIVCHGYADIDINKIRRCILLFEKQPLFLERDLKLLQWATEYYLANQADVFIRALPNHLRSESSDKPYLDGWRLQQKQLTTIRMSKAQQNACNILSKLGGSAQAMVLMGFGIATNTLNSLCKLGVISRYQTANNNVSKHNKIIWDKKLTSEQQQAINNIQQDFDTFGVTLIQGVTGSGKTEVYLRLSAHAIEQGKQVLIMVPEIGLTPQILGRFQKTLNANIVVMHSALDDTNKYHAWQSMRQGQADVLIGTRSAILTPCARLGCIIVDEEHDGSYKQQSGFRYNARDIAIVKGQYYGCPVVLGSATPSLSSINNIHHRNYTHIHLHQRATGIEQPEIELLAINSATKITAGALAARSIEQIHHHLRQQKQVMVFVNRRGFAQSLYCSACGWQAMCTNCDARMTLHQSPTRLICHHCHSNRQVPVKCDNCTSTLLSSVGIGTEQIAIALDNKFADTKVIRIDQDSVRGKGKLQERLNEIQSINPAILVGTQMLAKGHDFPHLSLVIVVGADDGLYSTDYRSIEQTCQLIIQVAGRSGRHGNRGKVIIQTTNPASPYMMALQQHNYQIISEMLMKDREEAGMPPYSYLVLIRAESEIRNNLEEQIQLQTNWLKQKSNGVEIFGPFEPTIQRLAKKYRRQILLISSSRKKLNQLCQLWTQQCIGNTKVRQKGVRWIIDVDPYDIF